MKTQSLIVCFIWCICLFSRVSSTSVSGGASPLRVSVNEDRKIATIATLYNAVVFVDLANPSSPTYITSKTASDMVWRAHTFGNLGIATTNAGFNLYDTTDTSNIALIYTNTDRNTQDSILIGNLLYVGGQNNYIRIFDVTTPSTPNLLRSITLDTNEEGGAFGIKFQKHPKKNVLYIGTNHAIFTVRLDNNVFNVTNKLSIPSGGHAFSISSGTFLHASTPSGYRIYDISCTNFNIPKLVSTTPLNGITVYDISAKTIFNRTFVAIPSVYESKVHFYDSTDPSNPILKSSNAVGALPQGAAIFGSQYVITADSGSGTATVLDGLTGFTAVDNIPIFQDDCPVIKPKTSYSNKAAACLYPPKAEQTCFNTSTLFSGLAGRTTSNLVCNVTECEDIDRNKCVKVPSDDCKIYTSTQRICFTRTSCKTKSVKSKCVRFLNIYWPEVDTPARIAIPNSSVNKCQEFL